MVSSLGFAGAGWSKNCSSKDNWFSVVLDDGEGNWFGQSIFRLSKERIYLLHKSPLNAPYR